MLLAYWVLLLGCGGVCVGLSWMFWSILLGVYIQKGIDILI
jgi:hypothetical protein